MAILKIKNENGEFINIPSIIGAKGDKGEQGIQGIQGEKGEKGDVGDTGYTLTNTVRGESVTIEDAVEFKLFSLEIDGKSVQNGTPTPTTPVEIESLGTYNETTGKYDIEVKVANGTDSKTTVLELNKPLRSLPNGVKDKTYIKNNKLYVDRYVGSNVLNGTEGWILVTGTNNYFTLVVNNIKQTMTTDGDNGILSNYFKGTRIVGSSANEGIATITDAIRVRYSNIATVEEFKTWLSTHNTEVFYEFTTPVTEEVGDCIIKTYEGVNNIDLETNLTTEFSVTYAQDMKSILKDYPSMEEIQQYIDSQLGTINEQLASLTEVE